MRQYSNIFGALVFLLFSFHLSEGKVLAANKNINETFEAFRDRNVVPIAENFKWHDIREKCNIQDPDFWYCCVGIESKLNFTACISIRYLEDEMGLEMNITVDGLVIIHEKVSARNPPPVCFHVPYLERIANVCFRLYNLDDRNNTISGCVDFEGHLEGFKVFKFDLGCFNLPLWLFRKEIKYEVKRMEHLFG